MNKQAEKQQKRIRRHARVRAKVRGTGDRPRLTVFKSNRGIYLQLIDDQAGRTLASVISHEIGSPASKNKEKSADQKQPGGRAEQCFAMGKLLAEKARAKKVKQVVFDRGGYKYHGLVKAVAEGAREGGLEF